MQNFDSNVTFGRDVKLLITSMGLMSFALGYNQVVQPIYLAMIGIPPVLIGVTISVATIVYALKMVLFGVIADRIGRRKIIFIIFMSSMFYNLIYAFARDYSLFLLAAIIGGANTVESYGGMIEGALLAEKAGDSKRTLVFSIQYFIASIFAALGNFSSGLPEVIAPILKVYIPDAIRLIYALQAILVLITSFIILFVSEESQTLSTKEEHYLSKESQKKLAKLSVVGTFDGFGVGMIATLFSLWFYLRYGINITTVGYIFTASRIFETITYLLGPPIVAKIGLIRSISITRLGGAIFVACIAFMPTYILAAILYTMRNATQHIAIPLRQSYTMAIFNRRERASAATISELSRILGKSTASTFSGYIIGNVSLMIPPITSSVFVGIASQLYILLFRDAKPPEEQTNAKSV